VTGGAALGNPGADAIRAGLERAYRIVGNTGDQTTIGSWLTNGFGGVTPPVLPFAPFHIHSAEFWARYFASHPAMAVGMARALEAFDDYGTLHLEGGNTVSGLIKMTTGLHVMDWAQKAYDYWNDVARQGNNNFGQRLLKEANYSLFNNNAFVRPFDWISGPAQALTERFTNPLMSGKTDFITHQPLTDPRDVMREYGSMSGTTGAAELVNDYLGNPLPRAFVQAVSNPGQALGRATEALTDRVFRVDRTPYNADPVIAHALGYVADRMGLSRYDAERAYYDPQTADQQALSQRLHDMVNIRMDTQALGRILPVQANAAPGAFEAKGIYQPKDEKGYMLDMEIGPNGFLARDLLSQPGNYFDTLNKIDAAKAQFGDKSDQVRALQGELSRIRAADVAQAPGALGPYFDALAKASQANSPYGKQYASWSQNQKDAYDAFNSLRDSADYHAWSALQAAQRASGGYGTPEEKAWYAAHRGELDRLTTIVHNAEQSIVDRFGINPKVIANQMDAALGKPNTYTNTDITKLPASVAATGGWTQNQKDAFDAFNDLRNSADYRAWNAINAAERAAGPFGSAEQRAWYNANRGELARLQTIVHNAEQSIQDRYGVNPKAIANQYDQAMGRTPTYPTTDLTKLPSTSPTSSGGGGYTYTPRSSGGGRGYTTSRSGGGTSQATAATRAAANDFYGFYNTLTNRGEKAAVLRAFDRAGVSPLGRGISAETYRQALAVGKNALADYQLFGPAAARSGGAGRGSGGGSGYRGADLSTVGMTLGQLEAVYQRVAAELRGGAPSTAQTYAPTTSYRTPTTTNASYTGYRSYPRATTSRTNRRRF